MRLAFVTWLALSLTASAQMTGFSGGSGGGSSGGGFSGGSGSSSGGFSGGSGSSSTSMSPTAGVSAATLLGSFPTTMGSRTSGSVQPSNPFASYYYNPYAQGLVSSSGSSSSSAITGFGQAVYSTGGAGGRTGSALGNLGSSTSVGGA